MLCEVANFFQIETVDHCELDNSLNVRVRRNNKPNGPVLELGLPLIASFHQSQAVAMIAQELVEKQMESRSPFARITRKIHDWFFDAAHLRDSWDHSLSRIRFRRGFFSTPIVMTIQLCVFLNRRIVWGFSIVSSTIANLAFRKYYLHAAANVIRYTGKNPFQSALQELPLLKRSYSKSLIAFTRRYGTRNPVDDIAGLVAAERKSMNKQTVQKIIADESKKMANAMGVATKA